jgi:hypothetical protein
MGWDWVEDYWNGNAFAVFTVVAGQANTLRLSSATGHTISVDLIAFLDSNDALPTYVPEPASLGFLAAGATLLTARRRRA